MKRDNRNYLLVLGLYWISTLLGAISTILIICLGFPMCKDNQIAIDFTNTVAQGLWVVVVVLFSVKFKLYRIPSKEPQEYPYWLRLSSWIVYHGFHLIYTIVFLFTNLK